MLRKWRQNSTLAMIETLERWKLTPAERLRAVIEDPQPAWKVRRDGMIELAIRSWALKDSVAAVAVAEVDQQRLSYFQSLCRKLGATEEQARLQAFMYYAALYGECVIKIKESNSARAKRRALLSRFIMGSDVIFPDFSRMSGGQKSRSRPLEHTAS